jgi:hypothetical protein
MSDTSSFCNLQSTLCGSAFSLSYVGKARQRRVKVYPLQVMFGPTIAGGDEPRPYET